MYPLNDHSVLSGRTLIQLDLQQTTLTAGKLHEVMMKMALARGIPNLPVCLDLSSKSPRSKRTAAN